MIEIEINDVKYNCPEKWEDMTFSNAIAVRVLMENGSDAGEILSRTTLVPNDIMQNISQNSINRLLDVCSFLNDLSIFDNKEPQLRYRDFDYGSLPYSKAEKCRQLIKTDKSLYEAFPDIFKVIYDIDINNEPFAEWIGTANFFLNKWFLSTVGSKLSQKLNILANRIEPESNDLKPSGVLRLT